MLFFICEVFLEPIIVSQHFLKFCTMLLNINFHIKKTLSNNITFLLFFLRIFLLQPSIIMLQHGLRFLSHIFICYSVTSFHQYFGICLNLSVKCWTYLTFGVLYLLVVSLGMAQEKIRYFLDFGCLKMLCSTLILD